MRGIRESNRGPQLIFRNHVAYCQLKRDPRGCRSRAYPVGDFTKSAMREAIPATSTNFIQESFRFLDADFISTEILVSVDETQKQLKKRRSAMKQRWKLIYPDDMIGQPMIYMIGHQFKVITSILNMNVVPTHIDKTTEKKTFMGCATIEADGEPEEIQKALDFLIKNRISVKIIS